MSNKQSNVVDTAREYYNSSDADNFYYIIWGGEDIHVGIYNSEDEPIRDASRRTVEKMASTLNNIGPDTTVLDVGAGYGGSARYIASTYGCNVTALNLSEVENERDREMNKKAGLDNLIDVVDGNFEELPYPDNSFDIVWSQDAILHSGNREKVINEVYRVLKPGGEFIFTDPMQADDCPEGVLKPILERIHLDTLGSPSFYRSMAEKLGMKELSFIDMSSQLPRHYGRVLKETGAREDDIAGHVSQEYIERMKKGLGHWVEGGNNGYLTWGIFHFKK